MRVSILIVLYTLTVVLAVAPFSATGQSWNTGTWSLYSDSACTVVINHSTFIDGACSPEVNATGGTIYEKIACAPGGAKFTEIQWSDSQCIGTLISVTNNASNTCFPTGQYWGMITCPSLVKGIDSFEEESILLDPTPVPPVSSASTIGGAAVIPSMIAAIIVTLIFA